jgi:hypothetical protein
MSTTFDLRATSELPHGIPREAAPVGRPAGGTPRRPASGHAPARGRTPGKASGTAQPKVAGQARPAVGVRKRLSLQPGGAGFFALVTLGLSLLGMIYLTQISHVARYGYLLSDLQSQQAKLDRENQLLGYQINGERTLARASDLASNQYHMLPYTSAPKVNTQTGTAIPLTPSEAAAQRSAAKIRFITVQRPAARPPVPIAAVPLPKLVDRLWNRIVGIGAAGQ